MKKVYLFVYGTLKKGFAADFILSDQTLISTAETLDKYIMIKSQTGTYPMLYEAQNNEGCNIKGEVYKVDAHKFCELDEYEGVPTLYIRKSINVILEDKTIVNAFIYVNPNQFEWNNSDVSFMDEWKIKNCFCYMLSKQSIMEKIAISKCPDAKYIGEIEFSGTLWKISHIDIEMLDLFYHENCNNVSKHIIALEYNGVEVDALAYKFN